MLINEFKESLSLELPLLVALVKEGVTTNGSPYVSVTFQDKSGTIEGKLWDVKPHQKEVLKQGEVVLVKFEVLKYRGFLQLKVTDVKNVDSSTIDINDYLPTGNIDVEQLKKEVYDAIDSIESPSLNKLVKTMMEKDEKNFFEYPAATKNHHEFAGGLATHVVGMLRVGRAISELYPVLNRDLLVAGILVHDMGKIGELTNSVVPDYSTEGRLLGHISIMQAKVFEMANQLGLDDEDVLLLRHMILSHHGEYEFGSPVLPMIPEAEVLHLIDNLDARMEMMRKTLELVDEGTFSQRIFSLENRSIYKASKK